MSDEPQAVTVEILDVKTVEKVTFSPGDVIVFTAPGAITTEAAERILAYAKEKFPDNKVMVLGDGLKVGVMTKVI